LVQMLSGSLPSSPSRAEAEATASRLKAHCQTLYALKRAPGGMGVDMLRHAPGGQPHRMAVTQDDGNPVRADNVGAMIRREKLAQYQELTPQQRVERLRQLKSAKDQNP